MSVERLKKIVDDSDLEGRRDRGRPCLRWLGGVMKTCNARSLELINTKVMCIGKE